MKKPLMLLLAVICLLIANSGHAQSFEPDSPEQVIEPGNSNATFGPTSVFELNSRERGHAPGYLGSDLGPARRFELNSTEPRYVISKLIMKLKSSEIRPWVTSWEYDEKNVATLFDGKHAREVKLLAIALYQVPDHDVDPDIQNALVKVLYQLGSGQIKGYSLRSPVAGAIVHYLEIRNLTGRELATLSSLAKDKRLPDPIAEIFRYQVRHQNPGLIRVALTAPEEDETLKGITIVHEGVNKGSRSKIDGLRSSIREELKTSLQNEAREAANVSRSAK